MSCIWCISCIYSEITARLTVTVQINSCSCRAPGAFWVIASTSFYAKPCPLVHLVHFVHFCWNHCKVDLKLVDIDRALLVQFGAVRQAFTLSPLLLVHFVHFVHFWWKHCKVDWKLVDVRRAVLVQFGAVQLVFTLSVVLLVHLKKWWRNSHFRET